MRPLKGRVILSTENKREIPRAFRRCGLAISFMTILLAGAAADAHELSRRAVGIYGSAWMPWIAQHPHRIDFLIYQIGAQRPIPQVAADLKTLREAGVAAL